MAGIRDEVELDVSQALAAIDSIGASLTQQVQQFQVSMAQSLDQLRAGPAIDTSGLVAGTAASKELAAGFESATVAAGTTEAATASLGGALGLLADSPAIQVLAGFFGAKALADGISGAAEAAATLDVQMKQVPIIFGDAASSVLAFGTTSVQQLALSEGAAVKAANAIGRVFTAQGVNQREAANLTTELLKRAADVATATGLTTDQVLTKFSGGLVGMSRAVRDLGAAFSVQEVTAKAAALGLEQVNGKYDQGALVQARAAIILEKTTYAQGQLAANSDTLLVKQRTLGAEWGNLTQQLGEKLLPVMLDVVKAIEGQLPTFEKLASAAIPLLNEAMKAALPLFAGVVGAFEILTPIMQAADVVLEHIPGIVKEVGLAFLLLGTGIGPLPNLLGYFGQEATAAGVKTVSSAGAAAVAMTAAAAAISSAVAEMAALGTTSAVAAAEMEPLITEAMTGGHAFVLLGAEARAAAAEIAAAGAASASAGAEIAAGGAASTVGAAEGAGAGGLAAMNPLVGALIVGLPVLTTLIGAHQAEQRRDAEAVKAASDAYGDLTKSVEMETAAQVKANASPAVVDSLRKAGVSFADLQRAIEGGGKTTKDFLDELGKAGALSLDALAGLRTMYEGIEKGAKSQIDNLVLTKQVTREVADEAIRLNTDGGVTNFTKALAEIRPAAETAAGGVGDLSQASLDAAAAFDVTDKAIKAIKTSLDVTFGRFLDAAGAVDTLQQSVYKLGEEYGHGPKKNQPYLDWQQNLQNSLRAVAKNIEANALAMADANQIGSSQAAVIQEMVRELRTMEGVFPALDKQIEEYIALLLGIPPKIDSSINLHISSDINQAGRDIAGILDQLDARGVQAGADLGNSLVDGIKANLDKIGQAGADAGNAAAAGAQKAIKESVLKSAGSGFDIGGFLVSGILLDPAGTQARDLNNHFAEMVKGIGSAVQDAIQITPDEQLAILTAVERVATDTQTLSDAQEKLGVDSIEAAKAQQQLAADEEKVSEEILKATDATVAYEAALKKLTDGVQSVTSSLRDLFAARQAADNVTAAANNLKNDQLVLTEINAQISHNTELLKAATAAREAAGGTAPSIQEQRLAATLADLNNQAGKQQSKTATDADKVTLSQLDLVSAQEKLVQLGEKIRNVPSGWADYFASLAEQAGLSRQQVDSLLASLNNAANVTQQIRNNVLSQNPGGIASAPPGSTLTGGIDFGSVAAQGVTNQNTFVLPPGSDQTTALQVVNELRAVAGIGG